MKIVGQNFWYLISENPNLYTDIIEPIGYRAYEHNENFHTERKKIVGRFSHEIHEKFFDPKSGLIDWVKLVQFNSGNLNQE
jgi:hypothetical protein